MGADQLSSNDKAEARASGTVRPGKGLEQVCPGLFVHALSGVGDAHGGAAGVAALLVPFIVSTTAHQRDNAAWMAAQGAAIHLAQPELTPERLAGLLRGLDRSALQAMAGRARALARPHAAARVADEIERLVRR